jgi:hypothetical protein
VKTRKLGRFRVDNLFFRDLRAGECVGLFDRMVVLRAHEDFAGDCVEYIAMHPDFDELPPEQLVPLYEATFTYPATTPTWSRSRVR